MDSDEIRAAFETHMNSRDATGFGLFGSGPLDTQRDGEGYFWPIVDTAWRAWKAAIAAANAGRTAQPNAKLTGDQRP